MRDDERGRHNLEAKDPLARRFLYVLSNKRILTLGAKRCLDLAQDLDHIGTRSTAGIEGVDVLVSKPVRDAEFVAQDNINALHHVADDFTRRVPDTHLFP